MATLMNSSGSLRGTDKTKENATKRIMRDIAALERDPISFATYCPDESNIFKGHATIQVKEGLYEGIMVHIKIQFPPQYPFEPPAAYVEDSFPFTHEYHEHVHSGGSICCDLTSNFKFFFSKEERSGWVSACSLSSLLMQLGTFFSDPDLPKHLIPKQDRLLLLRELSNNYSCKVCGHSTKKPFPPFVNKDEEKTSSLTSKMIEMNIEADSIPKVIDPEVVRMEALKSLECTATKSNLFDEPSIVLGYPMLLKRDYRGRLILDTLVLELLSYDAFVIEIVKSGFDKLDFYEHTMFTSPLGSEFNYWLPVYLTKEHFSNSLETIKNCFSTIKHGSCSGTSEHDFKPEIAMEICLTLLNKAVVKMLNGTLHESSSAITAYVHLIRLLLSFLEMYPGLQGKIETKIQNFLQGPHNRTKEKIPDIGEFIIACFLSRHYKFNAIKDVLLEEYFARQILWMQKAGVTTSNFNSRNLAQAFEATKVSNQLLVFAISSAKTFIFPGICNKLDERCGFAPTQVIENFQAKIKEIKTKVINYPILCKSVDININNEVELIKFLSDCHDTSVSQRYTKGAHHSGSAKKRF